MAKEATYKKVTMTSYSVGIDEHGKPVTYTSQSVDPHVPAEFADAYAADAQTRWQHVAVEDAKGEPKNGTTHPEHLKRGKTLQQHLHDEGVKPLHDPTNGPDVSTADFTPFKGA